MLNPNMVRYLWYIIFIDHKPFDGHLVLKVGPRPVPALLLCSMGLMCSIGRKSSSAIGDVGFVCVHVSRDLGAHTLAPQVPN